MGSNIIELAKLGHERAAELKASCGAVDVRSVAQLISDLATQLEVQLVRGNAQAVQLANAESKCRELAAENVTLNDKMNKLATWPGIEFYSSAWEFNGVDGDTALEFMCDTKTPATDAFLAEMRAQESAPLVRALTVIANSEQHDGETVVCDFDTLISVAAGALRDHYAAQLRKGAAL
ncbi:hypothetical protein MLN09_21910 [Escherichia coli]|uniref:hypothetical protein n=1 Tax=Escherichia coli TaxID=562 RepID=UPI000BE6B6A4|nr:hypothetical protein [Escherichia coli]EHC9995832.1 hypothetical protein [Escherichia coli]MCN1990850.1 hypothetical protein [Escherichia coli]MCN2363495.1 hypothetical protein [Escherichia coli]MCN6178552.1 hypothetical protein [Escherichia coli]